MAHALLQPCPCRVEWYFRNQRRNRIASIARCRPSTRVYSDANCNLGEPASHLAAHETAGETCAPRAKTQRRDFLAAAASIVALGVQRHADAKAPSSGGDWTSPGLAAAEDDSAPRFLKTASGVKIQELRVGAGMAAKQGDRVLLEYVLRRGNGYFIYSTVEGVSFQPRSVETGPIVLTLGDGQNIAGLEEAIEGMQPAGKRRVLVPPELGYVTEGLLPQPPGYAAKRQVINHSTEGLIFEVQLVRIRDAV